MKTRKMMLGAVLIAAVLVLSSCTGKGDSFADTAQEAEDLRMEQDAAIAEFEDNRSDAVKAAEEENALLELELKKLRIKQLHDLRMEQDRARAKAFVMTPAEVLKRKAECQTQIAKAAPCVVPTLNEIMATGDVDQVHAILLKEDVCHELRQKRMAECFVQQGIHNNPAFVDPDLER